jgi:hypothetical protein
VLGVRAAYGVLLGLELTARGAIDLFVTSVDDMSFRFYGLKVHGTGDLAVLWSHPSFTFLEIISVP